MRTELHARFCCKGAFLGELWFQDSRDDTDSGVYCAFNYWIMDTTHEYIPSEELPETVAICERIRQMAEKVQSIHDWFQIAKIEIGDYHFNITEL